MNDYIDFINKKIIEGEFNIDYDEMVEKTYKLFGQLQGPYTYKIKLYNIVPQFEEIIIKRIFDTEIKLWPKGIQQYYRELKFEDKDSILDIYKNRYLILREIAEQFGYSNKPLY